MKSPTTSKTHHSSKRRVLRAAYWHAFLWGLGLGLISAHLLRYLVRDLCRENGAVYLDAVYAWIIAAPRAVGVLRLLVPGLIGRWGNRKAFCIAHTVLAAVVLAGIPALLLVYDPEMLGPGTLFALLIVFWALYHLAGAFSGVALFSWYGDFVPKMIRGRFFGFREAWLTAGMAIGALSLGLYSYYEIDVTSDSLARRLGYLAPTWRGIVCLFLSALPLLWIPEIASRRPSKSLFQLLSELLAPLNDRRFAAFVFFGCWVQMSQALTQGIQYGFMIRLLGVSLLFSLLLSTETRLGQWLLGGALGRLSDTLGTLPVMSFSLIMAACGSLFYYFAEAESWYLLLGASTAWIFWIGVNIGITKTILRLAPKGESVSYFSVYFTIAALCFAAFALLGGYVIPSGRERPWFLASFGLRLASVPLLWFVFRSFRKTVE